MKQIFLMCGPSGAGKSTWIQKQIQKLANPKTAQIISRDVIRFSFLTEDDDYFAHENVVFEEMCYQCQQAIDNDAIQSVFIDATHLTPRSRSKILSRLSIPSTMELIAVDCGVPFEVCKAQNEKRSGRALVPETALRNMYDAYSAPSVTEKWNYSKIIKMENDI